MRQLLSFVLVAAILLGATSCVSSPKETAVKQTQTLAGQIPLFGMNGVVVSSPVRKMVYEQVARFPQTHKHIGAVAVVLQLRGPMGRALMGLWDGDIVILAYSVPRKMKYTLWHELAHVHALENLSEAERKEWSDLYKKRLKDAGVELSPFTPLPLEPVKGFPSQYSMTNVHEFVAEQMENYMRNPDSAPLDFPKAFELLVKHGFMPRDYVPSEAAE